MKEKRNGDLSRFDRSKREKWLNHLARRFGYLALVLVGVYAAFVTIAPFLISSSLVRSSMERAVSQWTGHRASIEGIPEIAFWPEPRITLARVSISKETDGTRQVIGRIERLSARFGLYDALRGAPVFRDFSFFRPEIFVARDQQGHLDWTNEGLLSAAVRGVEPREGDRQTLNPTLDARIGTITVEQGSIEIADGRSGPRTMLDGISADIIWPRLSDEFQAVARFRLAGQDVRLDLSTRQPLLLLGGKNATTRATLTSDAVNGTFDGVANVAASYFLSGSLEATAADIPALISWTGAELPDMKPWKQGSLQAQLSTVGDSLRFSGLKFALNDISASGIMELARPEGGKPRISGTLAFDKMDVGALLGAFSLHLPSATRGGGAAQSGLLSELDFDLTLSAREAALLPFQLEDVAASIFTGDGKAKFDIADSRFEGGRLTGHLDGSGSGFEDGGNLRISARDADLQSIAKRLALEGPMPVGKGSLELSLRSSRPLWATRLADIDGLFKLHMEQGSLPDIDLAGIRALAADRAYFRMSEAGDDGIDFTRLDIAAKFANGAAELEQAELVTKDQTLTLSGLIPYASNSLALLGQLKAAADVDATAGKAALRFFIGGSWPDPILSPILSPPEKM